MEAMAKNIDRLVTTLGSEGGCVDRWLIPPLYEIASGRLGGRPISLVAAQRMIDKVKLGDSVFLTAGFGAYPNVPFGETDGPLGVASLARAVWFGLGAIPVIVAGARDIDIIRQTVKAAGFYFADYKLAKEASSAAAVEVTFPCVEDDESSRFAAQIMDEYAPKALISVEAIGPNKMGIKHCGGGTQASEAERLPGLEYLFYEASAREVLSIGIIDLGNELGSGTIEEDIRRIVPNANVCKCPCQSGTACSVAADIVFPAAISNWGAYAITAMIGALLRNPDILHDSETEWRMLDACIMAGAVEGLSEAPIMAVDGVDVETGQGLIRMLHSIVRRTLSHGVISEAVDK